MVAAASSTKLISRTGIMRLATEVATGVILALNLAQSVAIWATPHKRSLIF